MEKALRVIGQSAVREQDDNILMCSICQLTFASLYNKQSHYSGKLHLQTLLQYIDDLMRQDITRQVKLDNDGATFISSSLENVAVDYSSRLEVIIDVLFEVFLRFFRRKISSWIQNTTCHGD